MLCRAFCFANRKIHCAPAFRGSAVRSIPSQAAFAACCGTSLRLSPTIGRRTCIKKLPPWLYILLKKIKSHKSISITAQFSDNKPMNYIKKCLLHKMPYISAILLFAASNAVLRAAPPGKEEPFDSSGYEEYPSPDPSNPMTVLQSDIYVEFSSGRSKGTSPQGINLYIRKKPGVESVLLVETSTDPEGKEDNLTYRAQEYNSINGDEKRLLNGKFLESEWARYSLVSSTPTTHPKLGECFLIYIPPVMVYGYPWERHGSVTVGKGTFINIRTFSKKYADYAGTFQDNPFMFNFNDPPPPKPKKTAESKKEEPLPPPPAKPETSSPKEPPSEPKEKPAPESVPPEEEKPSSEEPAPPKEEPSSPKEEPSLPEEDPPLSNHPSPTSLVAKTPASEKDAEKGLPNPEKIEEPVPPPDVELLSNYNPKAVKKFDEISKAGGGVTTYSKGPETLKEDLIKLVDGINPKDTVDVVFAIDTTGSMKDDLASLRKEWVPALMKQLDGFGDVRLGLVFYRDYGGDYNYKGLPVKIYNFTSNRKQFVKDLNSPVIKGNEGGDVPEAVYEALFAAEQFFSWRPEAQKRIILIGDAEPHPRPRGNKTMTLQTVTDIAQKKGIKVDCIIVPNTR